MKPRFWSAFALSAFGYEITFFIATLVVFNRGRDPLEVGLFTAITLAPKLLAPFFGTVCARIGGRTALSAACGIAGVLIACLGFTGGGLPLFILWFLISCLFVVISNVRTTLMVDLMGRQGNRKGNSAVLLTLNAVRILVPLLGGIGSLALPPRLFFGLIGIVHLAAMCLAWTSDASPIRPKNVGAISPLDSLRRGAREIAGNPVLSLLLAIVILRQVFLGVQTSFFVVYVKSLLRLGDAEYGYFIAAIGAGSIAGSLLGSRLKSTQRPGLPLLIGLGAHFLSFAGLGFVRTLWGAVALMGGSFAVFCATVVSLHSLRDLSTPSDVRGEVYGVTIAAGVPPAIISMLAGSFFMRTAGIQSVLTVCGTGAAACLVLCFAFLGRRSLKREGARERVTRKTAFRKGESIS